MKRSAFTRLGLAMILGAFTLGTTGVASAAEPIKIGFLSSFSGYLAGMGTAGRDGFGAAIDEINSKGGINGRQLQAVYENDESETAKGVPAAIRLMNSEKVSAMVGPVRSDVTEALGPMVEKAQIPHITLSFGVPVTHGYSFSAVPSPDDEAKTMVKFLKKQGAKSIVILTALDAYDKGLATAVETNAKAQGIQVLASESYNAATDRNLIPQLSKLKAANADWLVVAGAAAGTIAKQRGEIGYTGKMLGNLAFLVNGLESQAKIAGDGLEESYLTATQSQVWNTLPKDSVAYEKANHFRETYKAKYGAYPDADKLNYAAAYDVAMLLAEAIKRAGPDATGPQIKAQLEKIKNFPGANASYTFTPENHANNGNLLIARVHQGAFVLEQE